MNRDIGGWCGTRRAWLLLTLVSGLWLGCSGQPAHPGTSADLSGTVTGRTEGLSARPDWADANQPWSRYADSLRVVGYVSVRADQRKEMAYRAADSYARAELVRFLSSRVVSVLEDQVKTGEAEQLRERIDVTAQSFVDELTIEQRYWERRQTADGERLHVWSRLDIDRAAVAELLRRATQDASNLTTPTPEIVRRLHERWDRFADVAAMNQGKEALPPGVAQPAWARTGDRANDVGFEFVCHGLAKDEKTARAMAQARCNEKFCRLFGVQISAKTTVTENLDGVTAQSEVSEQCSTVRLVGRETRNQAGECGPEGCVQWILQTYPRPAYEREKQRLEQPTVIQQQIVIQEGDKLYRDPAACEASLRAYGDKPQELTGAAFERRRQHLQRAMQVCQGIDGRDSGLFSTLNTLLMTPIAGFTVASVERDDSSRLRTQMYYLVADGAWRNRLETQRFLTDRIASVLTLVKDALVPLKLVDLTERPSDPKAVEAVVSDLLRYPFVAQPASIHHRGKVHALALSALSSPKVPYSLRYRNYLMTQLQKGQYTCSSRELLSGSAIIKYLAADGKLDEEEWRAGLAVLRNDSGGSDYACFDPFWNRVDHGGQRGQRIDQISNMIVAGEIKTKDPMKTLGSFLRVLEKAERGPVFFKYRTRIRGSATATESIVNGILRDNYRFDFDWERNKREEGVRECEAMPRRLGNVFAEVPEADPGVTGLCLCLRMNGLTTEARRSIGLMLYRHAKDECGHIRPEDWPEPYYQKKVEYLPGGQPAPFSGITRLLKDEFSRCFAQHQLFDSATVGSYLTSTVVAGRLSNVRVDSVISGEQKQLSYKDKRRGLARGSDIAAVSRNLAQCLQVAATGYVIPPAYHITKEPGPKRIWIQFWNDAMGSSGFIQ